MPAQRGGIGGIGEGAWGGGGGDVILIVKGKIYLNNIHNSEATKDTLHIYYLKFRKNLSISGLSSIPAISKQSSRS